MQKNEHYLTVDELASLARLSARTIYNRRSAGGLGLPPSTKLPKCRRVLFRASDVESWINHHKRAVAPIG
jgi:predicted DNA-binding transcriptional regulator AlpA